MCGAAWEAASELFLRLPRLAQKWPRYAKKAHILIATSIALLMMHPSAIGKEGLVGSKNSKAGNRKSIFLYDVVRKDGMRVEGALLAERVYLRFDQALKRWIYVKTNSIAEFPAPTEEIRVGSVLPAKYFGLNTLENYKLTPKAWIATREWEIHTLRVNATPPHWKTVSFKKIDPSEMAFLFR